MGATSHIEGLRDFLGSRAGQGHNLQTLSYTLKCSRLMGRSAGSSICHINKILIIKILENMNCINCKGIILWLLRKINTSTGSLKTKPSSLL